MKFIFTAKLRLVAECCGEQNGGEKDLKLQSVSFQLGKSNS
jgi:hypothetical protein